VRREDVTHDVGHPVSHNWQVARSVVFAAEEKAVRFERVESIRRIHDDVATGCQHPKRLLNAAPIVVDVLDDLVEQDDVEALAIERQFFSGRDLQIR